MSTPLKDGIYALHYVPPGAKLPFAGGVYATGDQPNHPVLAQAHNPAVVKGFQKVIIARSLRMGCSSRLHIKWHIKPALGSSPSDGKYTITAPGLATPPGAGGHGPVVPGFGYDRFEGDQAILLTTSLKEFYIQPANDGKDGDITYVLVPIR